MIAEPDSAGSRQGHMSRDSRHDEKITEGRAETQASCSSDMRKTANDKYELWKLGITHVLNAAHGRRYSEGNPDFYGTTITYHGVPANDVPEFDMSKYFYSSAAFIQKALTTPGARLLVHCVVGISRSATLVLAYLLIHHQFSLIQAIRTVQEKRWISPNTGFLQQLIKLDEELRQTQDNQTKSEANQHGEEV
ncbi:dual specificity protein phosphatase 13A isoform X2 [Dendrobates tinctorius]|uniref:dual specificity protein phosphatase 13A isoform X2 n=1 Tax=Dendrobates tinctorius TaxID=92724 RepID=UPI003CC9965C